ncbi:unnamed protein product [Darwinula stevensoni]|uniref:Uncharacterized protein n=1 Tax=Darwinula stevensoni TaxID=69355 RepID=A0A7R8XCE9_9CRUS|nr:unnamed protein product [Darwinula stevensoni]CAG0892100.1 unnamed protein product [Darwinula stevensoni]
MRLQISRTIKAEFGRVTPTSNLQLHSQADETSIRKRQSQMKVLLALLVLFPLSALCAVAFADAIADVEGGNYVQIPEEE